jgi:hypothetical protein
MPTDGPRPLTEATLLIGEGVDEVNFFEALIKHLGLSGIQVEQYGGRGNLRPYLKEFGVRPDRDVVQSLGITRDADDQPQGAFQSVCALLQANGLPAPAGPGQIVDGPPRVGVFIMPDNQSQGMLEDLCLAAVQGQPGYSCLDDYFQCIQAKANRTPNNLAKARVYAWLSTQIDPEVRLGVAAQRRYWPWDEPAFTPLRTFLQQLCLTP